MKLFAHEHHRCDDPWAGASARELELREMFLIIILQMEVIMADFTKVTADIAAQKTVLQGVVVFIDAQKASNATLTQQVADLQALIEAQGDPAIQAAVDAIDTTVQENTALAAGALPAIQTGT